MYTLYYSPGACSMAIHVLLNELNQPVKLVDTAISSGKNRDPEFLKLNPRGQVPVLVDDGHAIREGGAIITYLMDKHDSKLWWPKSGFARASALQWLMFANATLHIAYSRVFGARKINVDDNARAILVNSAIDNINNLWAELNNELANKPYICGDEVSPADILMTVIANWSYMLPEPDKIILGDNVKRMIKSVVARPAYQKALATENVQYKAAA